jgi:hypothetical protein
MSQLIDSLTGTKQQLVKVSDETRILDTKADSFNTRLVESTKRIE